MSDPSMLNERLEPKMFIKRMRNVLYTAGSEKDKLERAFQRRKATGRRGR